MAPSQVGTCEQHWSVNDSIGRFQSPHQETNKEESQSENYTQDSEICFILIKVSKEESESQIF